MNQINYSWLFSYHCENINFQNCFLLYRNIGSNHLLHCRKISIKIKRDVLHLSGALMESKSFIKALVSLFRKMICIYYSSHLGDCNNVLMEQFLQGNVPIRHQLKEEFLFMSRRRSAIIEDNDWAHHQTKKIAI